MALRTGLLGLLGAVTEPLGLRCLRFFTNTKNVAGQLRPEHSDCFRLNHTDASAKQPAPAAAARGSRGSPLPPAPGIDGPETPVAGSGPHCATQRTRPHAASASLRGPRPAGATGGTSHVSGFAEAKKINHVQ